MCAPVVRKEKTKSNFKLSADFCCNLILLSDTWSASDILISLKPKHENVPCTLTSEMFLQWLKSTDLGLRKWKIGQYVFWMFDFLLTLSFTNVPGSRQIRILRRYIQSPNIWKEVLKELFSVSHSPTEASPCLLDSLKGKHPHSFMWYSIFHLLPEPWKLEVMDRTQALRHWCGAVFCRLNGQTCQRLFMTESILSTFSAFLIIVKTSPISISWNGKFSTASLANVQKNQSFGCSEQVNNFWGPKCLQNFEKQAYSVGSSYSSVLRVLIRGVQAWSYEFYKPLC